jgi:hypothetical protein
VRLKNPPCGARGASPRIAAGRGQEGQGAGSPTPLAATRGGCWNMCDAWWVSDEPSRSLPCFHRSHPSAGRGQEGQGAGSPTPLAATRGGCWNMCDAWWVSETICALSNIRTVS